MSEGTWYRTGLVSLAHGSDLVDGTGTEFVSNVLPGAIFIGPVGLFEVERAISDSQLKLVKAYTGPTVSGAEFEVAPTQGAVVAATKQLQAFLVELGALKLAWDSGELEPKGLTPKGVKNTVADLPAVGNLAGDCWLVDGVLYMWTGSAWSNQGATVTTPELEALRMATVAAKDEAIGIAGTLSGAADSAVLARAGAEEARDAARAVGKPYATVALALADAALLVGAGFTVPLADGSVQAYRKDSAAVAIEIGSPQATASSVAAQESAARLAVAQPNLFTKEQLDFAVLPTLVASTSVVELVNGIKTIRVVSTTTTARCYWRQPAAAFPSGKVSAQITIERASAGTTGLIVLLMRNSAGTTIKTVTLLAAVPSAAITAPLVFRTPPNTVIEPLTANIDLDVTMSKTTAPIGRDFNARAMFIADGDNSTFRQPAPIIPEVPVLNFFPNPALTAEGATLYQANRIIEDAEKVLSIAGTGTLQVFYEIAATGAFSVGSTLVLTGEAKSDVAGAGGVSADMNIICLNAAGAAIGTSATPSYLTAGAWVGQSVTRLVPDGTATVRFRFVKRTAAAYAKFRRMVLSSNSPQAKMITVQVTDTPAAGSRRVVVGAGADYPDIQAGINAAKPFGLVVVREGDYAPFSISGFYGQIVAYRNERVRVIGATPLAGITKTAGYTHVYQAALAIKPNHYIWEHDTPDASTVISIEERHPLQRGQATRLPSTRMMEVDSIAAIDAVTTPKWFWLDGVIYFRMSDGEAPGERKVYVPRNGSTSYSVVTGGTGDETVSISGLIAMYGHSGFYLTNCARVRLAYCEGICNATQGIAVYDTPDIEVVMPRIGGNGNDGSGWHAIVASMFGTQCNVRMIEPWCHDNWDDADSMHERHNGSYIGGLYEYNGSGVATAYGATLVLHGGLVRKNGFASGNGNPSPKNLGVSSIGAAVDGGVGTQVMCFGTVVEESGTNFAASLPNNTIYCVGTKSYRGSVAGYSGTAGGAIQLRDATDGGSSVNKVGAVSAVNSALVF